VAYRDAGGVAVQGIIGERDSGLAVTLPDLMPINAHYHSQADDIDGAAVIAASQSKHLPAGYQLIGVRNDASARKGCNLRLYGPLEPWFDKTWKPSDFELVE